MRQQLYDTIKNTLLNMPGTPVRHVDIWNHNVEFIEQEEPFPMPAVFVEFAPIEWKYLKPNDNMHATAQLALHVVTQWDNTTQALQAFQLCNDIQAHIHNIGGEHFAALHLVESRTNHNHELIIDNVEVYQYKAFRTIPQKQPPKTLTRWQQANVVVGRTIPATPGNGYVYYFPDGIIKFRCRNLEEYDNIKQQIIQYLQQPDNRLSTYIINISDSEEVRGLFEPKPNPKKRHPEWVGISTSGKPHAHVHPHMTIDGMLDDVSMQPITPCDTRCEDVAIDDKGNIVYIADTSCLQHGDIDITTLPQHWTARATRNIIQRINDGKHYVKQTDEYILTLTGAKQLRHPYIHRCPGNIMAIFPRHSRRKWYATGISAFTGTGFSHGIIMAAYGKPGTHGRSIAYRGEYHQEKET